MKTQAWLGEQKLTAKVPFLKLSDIKLYRSVSMIRPGQHCLHCSNIQGTKACDVLMRSHNEQQQAVSG